MPISNIFIPRILSKISKLQIYNEDDIDMMRYSLQAILWEIEKLVYLCIIFAFIQKLDFFLIATAALLSIRSSAGGYHSKSSGGCFMITFIAFLLAIMILPMLLPMNVLLYLSILIASLGITLSLAPICSEQREALIQKKHNKKKKFVAAGFILFWSLLVIFKQFELYRAAVLYIILFQSLQLLFEYFRRKRKRFQMS